MPQSIRGEQSQMMLYITAKRPCKMAREKSALPLGE